MRPPREDIVAPPFPGRIRWLGADPPPEITKLAAAGPVLVHFFDFAQLNSARALPYVLEWHRRYRDLGLSVLGVHSPRYRFSGEQETVDAAIIRLGIEHPVADDSRYFIWHDYGCHGWPSLFLWGRGGRLRWTHFGEGEYEATELAIQEALGPSAARAGLPEPMVPLRPTDLPGTLVAPPSPELFPGGSPAEPWEAELVREEIELAYDAGSAWVVADGGGTLVVTIDDGQPRSLDVAIPGLHLLAEHPHSEHHRLLIEAGPGTRIWALSFAAGMPAA